MKLTPMLKSRCLMFSVPSDQVYSELGAVDSYASVRRKGRRPACRVVQLNRFYTFCFVEQPEEHYAFLTVLKRTQYF